MPVDLPPSIHLIDYAYSTGGVFYHGTISNLDGILKSTWTLSTGDQKRNFDDPIDAKKFDYLWESVNHFEVFKRTIVTSMDTKMDFYHFQVIGVVDTVNGEQKMTSYLISPAESDPQYKKWIAILGVPFEKSAK